MYAYFVNLFWKFIFKQNNDVIFHKIIIKLSESRQFIQFL